MLLKAANAGFGQVARVKVRGLVADGEPVVRLLGESLDRVLRKSFLPEEARRLAEIAALRERMENSSERIQRTDFGAGAPEERDSAKAGGVRILNQSVAEICRLASQPTIWAQLLFSLMRSLHPKLVLEIGSCLGISGAHVATALAMDKGDLVHVDGRVPRAVPDCTLEL